MVVKNKVKSRGVNGKGKRKNTSKAKGLRKRGRHESITPEIEAEIIHALTEGMTFKHICKDLKISRNTEWAHRERHEEYRLKVESALSRRISIVEDSLYQRAVDGDVNAQKFFLTNLSHGRFRNVQDHRIGGEEKGKPIQIEVREIIVEIPAGATEADADEPTEEESVKVENPKKK